MSRSFIRKSFLRHCDKDLFQELFPILNITTPFPEQQDNEKDAAFFSRYLESLPETEQLHAEQAFRDINDLSRDDDVLIFLELKPSLSKEFEEIENPYNKAMYCYIHHQNTFRIARLSHEVINLKTRKEVFHLERKSVSEVLEKKEALENALITMLGKKEGRGRKCKVEPHVDNDRISLVAYPEDYLKTEEQYNHQGELDRRLRKSVARIIYIYYPELGKLEIGARGQDKRKLALVNIFIATVLESSEMIYSFKELYDLGVLWEEGKTLAPLPHHEVEYIKFKELAFRNNYRCDEKIVLYLNRKGGLEPMRELMAYKRINKEHYTILWVTINIKFPGRRKRGSVTMRITPTGTNLNDSVNDKKAKEYLNLWGFEIGQGTQALSEPLGV